MTAMPPMDSQSLLAPQDWTFPVPIAYGPGRLAELGAKCVALGVTNPLVVTDRNSRDLPFITRLRQVLAEAGVQSGLFCEIAPNPRDADIGAGRAAYRAGHHDAIIAIGGGSAMDGAKSVCLTATNARDLWDFDFELTPPDMTGEDPFPPLICIPTTAGTGAETESTAMVTHTGKGMKLCVWHPELKPCFTLLDPELLVGLPANLTAWTGVDALTHAIEAHIVPQFHPLCDGAALEGLALIAKWLPVAVAEPENLEARGGMLVGSCLAGVAFLKGLGLVHAISHMVGAEFDTQHGLTNAVLLPVVMRYNLPGLDTKVEKMAQAMGLEQTDTDGLIAGVEALLDRLDIPRSLAEIGVTPDCVDRVASKAMLDIATTTNPRQASLEDIKTLLATAIEKAR